MRHISSLSFLILAWAALLAPGAAVAHSKAKTRPVAKVARLAKTPPPESVGTFGDWQAATHTEAGETICYAFSRPQSSAPANPTRGDVVLTVTERAKLRDTVALSAGFSYPANATADVAVDGNKFALYTAGRSAFAHDGAALIAAFNKGNEAVFTSPVAKGKTVVDHFSLKGFSAALKAVLTICPDAG